MRNSQAEPPGRAVRRTVRQPGALRKQQIADAALEIIGVRGLHHFTAREIGHSLVESAMPPSSATCRRKRPSSGPQSTGLNSSCSRGSLLTTLIRWSAWESFSASEPGPWPGGPASPGSCSPGSGLRGRTGGQRTHPGVQAEVGGIRSQLPQRGACPWRACSRDRDTGSEPPGHGSTHGLSVRRAQPGDRFKPPARLGTSLERARGYSLPKSRDWDRRPKGKSKKGKTDMSELIENTRRRKDLLKHMILQLHEGKAPEARSARSSSRLLGQVPYDDGGRGRAGADVRGPAHRGGPPAVRPAQRGPQGHDRSGGRHGGPARASRAHVPARRTGPSTGRSKRARKLFAEVEAAP